MLEQAIKTKQRQQQVWISRDNKEVLFSEADEYECIEFTEYEALLDYVKVCVACGYKIG